MKNRIAKFLTVALFAVTLGFLSPASAQDREPAPPAANGTGNGWLDTLQETLVVDVACDATTFRLNKSGSLLDARRGDGFIVQGKIYPGGTIAPGGTMQNPGTFDPRTAPGSLGDWVCRGNFSFDIGQILLGAEPHLFSTQHHIFTDGKSLVHDGPEGGGRQVRAIIGGTGAYAGYTGEVIEEPLGINATGLFNIRFTFKLKKK